MVGEQRRAGVVRQGPVGVATGAIAALGVLKHIQAFPFLRVQSGLAGQKTVVARGKGRQGRAALESGQSRRGPAHGRLRRGQGIGADQVGECLGVGRGAQAGGEGRRIRMVHFQRVQQRSGRLGFQRIGAAIHEQSAGFLQRQAVLAHFLRVGVALGRRRQGVIVGVQPEAGDMRGVEHGRRIAGALGAAHGAGRDRAVFRITECRLRIVATGAGLAGRVGQRGVEEHFASQARPIHCDGGGRNRRLRGRGGRRRLCRRLSSAGGQQGKGDEKHAPHAESVRQGAANPWVRQAKTSVTTRVGSTPVIPRSTPVTRTLNFSWFIPSVCRMVALKSRTSTGFSSTRKE